METIFDFLNSILFSKKNIKLSEDNKTSYVPFLVNRWCSFYSKEVCSIVNHTVNRFSNLSKEEHYTFLKNIINRVPFKKINYIKKNKDTQKNNEDDTLSLLAKNLELSKREINQYIICQQSQ